MVTEGNLQIFTIVVDFECEGGLIRVLINLKDNDCSESWECGYTVIRICNISLIIIEDAVNIP